jgi:dihydrofolate reductase
MRRLIEYCLVSADGIVLDDPFPFRDYDDDAYLRDRLGVFAACDAILCGRVTYERFATRLPGSEARHPYVTRLNEIQKYVFSSQLETAEWNNSAIIRADAVAEVVRLKQEHGGDLLILGHGRLGQTLLKEHLIDVIDLALYPVFVAQGRPFVREDQAIKLKLASTKSFSKVVKLTYEPQY